MAVGCLKRFGRRLARLFFLVWTLCFHITGLDRGKYLGSSPGIPIITGPSLRIVPDLLRPSDGDWPVTWSHARHNGRDGIGFQRFSDKRRRRRGVAACSRRVSPILNDFNVRAERNPTFVCAWITTAEGIRRPRRVWRDDRIPSAICARRRARGATFRLVNSSSLLCQDWPLSTLGIFT